MKVIIAPEAEAQLLIRKRWWRVHRPKAPERFDQELAEALTQIGQMPESFPVYSRLSGRTVRRCLLRKASCHLYFNGGRRGCRNDEGAQSMKGVESRLSQSNAHGPAPVADEHGNHPGMPVRAEDAGSGEGAQKARRRRLREQRCQSARAP